MSVINDVLKDLEARESRFTPIELGGVETAARPRRETKPLVMTALLLLALVTGAWVYLQPATSGKPTLLTANAQPAAESPSPRSASANTDAAVMALPTAVAALESASSADSATETAALGSPAPADGDAGAAGMAPGNQIVGLQIRESESEMRLEFVLRERVVAYLQERGQNSFAYRLRDIESRIDAPRMSDNPWVRALEIDTAGAGVDIRFRTAPGILVETRQNQVDGGPVWSISLRRTITAAETAADTAAEPAAVATAAPAPASEPVPVGDDEAPGTAAAAEVRLEIKATDPDARVANRLEYAIRLLESGRYADAENLLRELLGGTEDYQARRHLLALYHGRQRHDIFLAMARESAASYPGDAVFRTEYARALFQHRAYRQVVELLAAEVGLDAAQQSLLAASYQRLDAHEDAIRHYRLALREDAANAKNWIGLGISQEHSAELEAALDSYRRAGRLGPLSERLQAFVDERRDSLRRVLN